MKGKGSEAAHKARFFAQIVEWEGDKTSPLIPKGLTLQWGHVPRNPPEAGDIASQTHT